MDVTRDFKKRPPHWAAEEGVRPDLDDLVYDFSWRFPRSERDPVADYTAEARHLPEAISRACASRGADGKMSNHQSRVPEHSRIDLAERLIDDGLTDVKDFDKLFDIVESYGQRINGIGPVTVYDVSYRIACYLDLPVQSLYLHAGVQEGAQRLYAALGRPMIVADKKRIERRNLPAELRKMDPNDVEDFMCTYREVFPQLDVEDGS
jgi:hypothetical protein